MRRSLLSIVISAAAASGQPLPLEGIAHIGFDVRDLAKSEAYYTGILGLSRAFQSSESAAFFKVSDDQYIELGKGGTGDSPVQFHIALQTTDIAAARRLLRARGIDAPNAAKDSRGNLSFSLPAPEGTRLQFVPDRPDPLH